MTYRTRQLAAPPALPGPDQLDRTARQVRTDGGLVHRLAVADTVRPVGRIYSTDCGRTLFGADGAVLTTAEVECSRCNGTVAHG